MSERSTGGRIVDLLRDTVVGWIADDAGLLGAGLAYYGLLALAPLLLLVLSVTSVTLGEQAAEVQVRLALVDIFGAQAAQGISQMLSSVRSDRSITFTNALGAGVLLYASTRLFAQVQMALHICWGIAAAPGDMHHRIAQNILRRLAQRPGVDPRHGDGAFLAEELSGDCRALCGGHEILDGRVDGTHPLVQR